MQNVIAILFKEESSTYQALAELKKFSGTSKVLVAGIIKNSNGHISIKDGYNLEQENNPSWITGGLIGGLIGILAGPVGLLLGGGYGMAIGMMTDSSEAASEVGLITQVVSKLENYNLALVAIVDEEDEEYLNIFFNKYNPTSIIRQNVLIVQSEIYQAEEIEKKLRKDMKKHLKNDKKEEWHEKAKVVEENIKEKFDFLKKNDEKNNHK